MKTMSRKRSRAVHQTPHPQKEEREEIIQVRPPTTDLVVEVTIVEEVFCYYHLK